MTVAVEHRYRPEVKLVQHAYCSDCQPRNGWIRCLCGLLRPASAQTYPRPTSELCVVCAELQYQPCESCP